jgi:signal transduction histidine kinase
MTPRGPSLALVLPDGRTLLMLRPGRPPPPGPVLTFALIAIGVGVGAFPVVRRLTRRLERLQAGVTDWGAGNLATRLPVEGRDEVAQLASVFNDAAARIEKLVDAHKSLLANASHELRSPLARIRLGVELLSTDPSAARRDELACDIAELDQLIDEILLASRLEGGAAPEFEAVDFTALVAEECARAGASLEAVPAQVRGNARLLQRLVRNLIENALRYGGGRAEVVLRAVPGATELDVLDRGPGIDESERERVFEPFYRARGASESSGGVGLGLSLVRQIALQHGGHVHCLPRTGGGSVFRVTLPYRA